MRLVLVLLAAAAAVADTPKPPSSEDALVVSPTTAKFVEVTMPQAPKGLQQAMIGVDPHTKGAIGYGRTPAGTGLPAHWHSYAEYTALLSGSGTLVLDGKQHQVGPGSYFVIPAKVPHQFDCAKGADCMLLTRRAGPTDYNFIQR